MRIRKRVHICTCSTGIYLLDDKTPVITGHAATLDCESLKPLEAKIKPRIVKGQYKKLRMSDVFAKSKEDLGRTYLNCQR